MEHWVPGDVVEVLDNFSWKLATISKVSGKRYFVVRLLGSSLEIKVSKSNIRLRQSWKDEEWKVMTEGSVCCKDGKQEKNLMTKNHVKLSAGNMNNKRANPRVMNDNLLVNKKRKINAPSRSQERGSEGHIGAADKFRSVEKVGRLHRLIAVDPSLLSDQIDVFPGDLLVRTDIHPCYNNVEFSKVEMERRKPNGTVGCYLAENFESNDAPDVTCSVGSCSTDSNKLPQHVSAGHMDDSDANFSDAASYCHFEYEEGNCLPPTKKKLADEIHRLELHAYRCTMEALHALGPLSWEKEALVTNLRLSLNISNDEHLMEIRNLISADNSIPFR